MNAEISPETSDPRAIATAWALDELTPEERAAFEQQIENDSELAALAEETKAFCGVLSGSLGHPTLELQEAARSRLLFEADRPRREAKVVRAKWIRRLTTMAACVAAGSAGTWWWMMSTSERSYELRAASPVYVRNFNSDDQASEGNSAVVPVSTSAPADRRSRSETAATGAVSGPAEATVTAPVTDADIKKQEKAVDEARLAMMDAMKKHNIVDYAPLSSSKDLAQNVPAGVDFLQPRPASGPPPANSPENYASGYTIPLSPPADTAQPDGWSIDRTGRPKHVTDTLRTEKGIFVPGKPASTSTTPTEATQTYGGNGGSINFTGPAQQETVTSSPTPAKAVTLATTVPSRTSADALTTGDFDHREGAFAYIAGESRELTAGESYAQVVENPFRTVLKEPLSTFSTDVDTASYANVRRFLNMGQCPPPAAVRLEELVNYFPYDYAPPTDGKPFAVHVEMTSAPWDSTHRIARIALKGKEIAQGERPAANLVFLVDVSGSMDTENKLPLVKKSLKFVVERLTEKDTVSLVTYAGESGVALPATNGGDKQRISAAIDALRAGGSTNGAGGITTAYAQASQHFNKEGINRVILATDGDFNVGVTSNEDLLQLITDKAKSGTFLSVLGYGMGNTKDDRMELLADKGNGNYAYIDSLSEARKTLADQFNGTLVTIAKDVKVQIEFNPAVIRSYRLLGYENRMLAKEDFADDKKDAGEIGAGHTVTALYELIPVGVPDQPVNTTEKLKYQSKPEPVTAAPAVAADASSETMTVNLRWKAPDGEQSQLMEVPVKDTGAKISQSSPETRWAVAVAGFASLLNNSRHAGLSWEDVRVLARSAKGADANGYRGEFLQLLDKAASVRPTERQ
jgi:secreted protein with Ig-like and vWFA domain